MSPANAAGFNPSDWIALVSVIVAGIAVVASYFFFWRFQRERQRFETWTHIRNQRLQICTEFRHLALRLMDSYPNAQRPDEDLLRGFAHAHDQLQLVCGAQAGRAADGVYRLVTDAAHGNAPERVKEIFTNAMKDLKEQVRQEITLTRQA